MQGAIAEKAGIAYMDVGEGREQERKLEGLINKGLAFLPLTLTLSRKGRGDFCDTLESRYAKA
jgi:hypothetical protein